MIPKFTAHNIRLDDGAYTMPGVTDVLGMEENPVFLAVKRVLDITFPGERGHVRIVDLGCLEGGFAVEFARLGFDVLGIEVRSNNIAACDYVKARVDLPNLRFVQDDAWNVGNYGAFDVVFCSGLLYHLSKPKRFLELLSSVTRKVIILQTHIAVERKNEGFPLSDLTFNEGAEGRWYAEFPNQTALMAERESNRWASWDDLNSFWLRREHLLQAMQDVGFDFIAEQYDWLWPTILESIQHGYYKQNDRVLLIGIKTVS